jgi:hypothetical protein
MSIDYRRAIGIAGAILQPARAGRLKASIAVVS